ncbi:MAG: cyclic nucleotide-binding domain-containing protein [Betaproteobacteria bacterium]|nr:MAG: cyclic nucleotide-binding domain-containing protein [Betaproteobacteria bacterium]
MAQDNSGAVTDQTNLAMLERVGAGTAIAGEIFGLVGKSPFFAEFSQEDISILAGYMDVYRAQPGEIIIREGDDGDFMMLIVDGEIDILKKTYRAEQQHMTSAGPGMTLGEMSMIDGEPRFATCMASQPTTFAVLTRDNMAKIILDYPGLGSKILIKMVTMLSLRLRQTSARLLRVMDENR